MKLSLRVLSVLLLFILMATPACSLRGPEGIRRDIARSTGYQYDREFGMTLGRIGLAVARMAMDDDDEEQALIKGLTKVQVGIYRVENQPQNPGDLELGRVNIASWEPMVNIQEDDEDVLVLLKRKMVRSGRCWWWSARATN